jgi:transcriptional regulator with XRE-family HTH domain
MKEKPSMGETIRALRAERRWTQDKLAEQLHVTPQTVSKWETDQSLPDISQVPALAKVFDVSTDTLFGLEGEENRLVPVDFDYFDPDPDKAYRIWEERAEELSSGVPETVDGERAVYDFTGLGYRLCCPESSHYHAARAEKVLADTLRFAREHEKMMKDSRVPVRGAFEHLLCELLALAGDRDGAIRLAADSPLSPLQLAMPMEARVFFLTGDRHTEEGILKSCVEQAVGYFIDSAVALMLNYLDTDRPEKALECAGTAMNFIKLILGRDSGLPGFFHERDRGNVMHLAAVACVMLGREEEALEWLGRMTESSAELYERRKRAVKTALVDMDGFNIVASNDEYMRYRRRLLLQALDDPRLGKLKETDEWRRLREKAEKTADG